MTATLLGSFTLGDAIPGLKEALGRTGQALQSLKGVVDSTLGNLTALQNQINGIASDLDALKSDYLNGPVDQLNDAIDAAQDLLGDLNTALPGPYLDGVLAQLNSAIALLESLVPADYLSDQIDALNAGINGQQARLNGLVDDLDTLTDIADDVAAQTALLGQIRDTLQDAADGAIDGLVAYNEQLSQLLNSGVFVVSYTGSLSALGGEVDGVLPDTGLGGSTQVSGPLLIVSTANTAALAALNGAFGL